MSRPRRPARAKPATALPATALPAGGLPTDHEHALGVARDDLLARGLSPSYRPQVLGPARAFLAHATAHANATAGARPLPALRRADVERFLAYLADRGASAKTVARAFASLRTFFAILVRRGLVAQAPTDGMHVHAPPPAPPLQLSREAVARLLAAAAGPACDAPDRQADRPPADTPAPSGLGGWPPAVAVALRNRALVELLYAAGLRASEVGRARCVDLDLERATLLVRPAKRGEPRTAPLPPRALAALARYLQRARPALLGRRPDPGHLLLTRRATPLAPTYVVALVACLARRAGVRAHPHALRRALATHLARDGVQLPAVAALLGHRGLAVTARYVACDRDDLRRLVERLELAPPPGAALAPAPGSRHAPGPRPPSPLPPRLDRSPRDRSPRPPARERR